MPQTLKPHSFQQVLSERISLDDEEWIFPVPSLPTSESANEAGLIKMIDLSNKDFRHQLILRYVLVERNRAISSDPLDRYLMLSFANFRSLRSVMGSIDNKADQGLQPTTARECSDYIVKLLRAGITIQGVHYNFYGHSNSQLKSRSCFCFAASKQEISVKVESLGDFSKLKTVSKKAKRIGLLFSTARSAMQVDPKKVEDIPDIESGDYIFTDGCGLIGPQLARDLARRVGIVFRNVRYTPSVFQIRYRGYKGVVALDPSMKAGGAWLRLRKSMKNFLEATTYLLR